MDLTAQYPRSPREKVGGYMMLGRTVDKARAKLQNSLGEYHYDCPMDQYLFGFLQISADRLIEIVKNSENDEQIVEQMRSDGISHSDKQVLEFNGQFEAYAPTDAESQTYFEKLRQEMAPIDRI